MSSVVGSGGGGEGGSEGARERGSGGRNISPHLLVSRSPALPLPIPHSRSFKRDRIDNRVGSDFLDAFGDNSFTRLQSLFINPHLPDAGAAPCLPTRTCV